MKNVKHVSSDERAREAIKKLLSWIFDYWRSAGLIFLALCCFILQLTFETSKVKSEDDLLYIEGRLVDYSFEEFLRGRKLYYIRLNRYPCIFQIKADYVPLFRQAGFKYEVRIGDELKLAVLKRKASDVMDNDKKVRVYSISKEYYSPYLDINQIMEEENNRFYFMYGGFFLLIMALIMYVLKKKKIYVWY